MAAVLETPIGRYTFYDSKEAAEGAVARLSKTNPESNFWVVEYTPWCTIPPPRVGIEGDLLRARVTSDILNKLKRDTEQKH